MLVSFNYMPTDMTIAVSSYLLSQFLDAFDGHAARALQQCTKFGAVLDMVTDRCSTMGMLIVLASFYPKYQFIFICVTVLDISSHWVQVYSNLSLGQSHKTVKETGNFFLRLYYTSRPVLFTMCAGNELFFAMLYIMHFTTGPAVLGYGIVYWIAVICFPISFVKNSINVIQLVGGFDVLAELDVDERKKIQIINTIIKSIIKQQSMKSD